MSCGKHEILKEQGLNSKHFQEEKSKIFEQFPCWLLQSVTKKPIYSLSYANTHRQNMVVLMSLFNGCPQFKNADLTLLHSEWPKLLKSFGCSGCNRVNETV